MYWKIIFLNLVDKTVLALIIPFTLFYLFIIINQLDALNFNKI